MPARNTPIASSVVPIGRSMKGREKLIAYSAGRGSPGSGGRS